MDSIRFADDKIKELTPERVKAIKEYVDMQEKYKELAQTWVTGYFFIKYLNEELDVDNLSEEQQKRLDNCKDNETREHLMKDLPKVDTPYDLYCISPFRIEEVVNKYIMPVDQLDTYIIEEINKRIKTRLDLYTNL